LPNFIALEKEPEVLKVSGAYKPEIVCLSLMVYEALKRKKAVRPVPNCPGTSTKFEVEFSPFGYLTSF
jgi:hypothetical protein